MIYNIKDFQYMVSLYCPGECVNCGIWKLDKNELFKQEIDISLFEKVLQSKALENANYIQLTGGEVQLSSKYIEAVKLISKYKKDAFIHTNISGWYPKKHFEVVSECLKYVDKSKFRIDISLDGNRENYKKVRLVKNGFDKVLETLELLKTITDNLRFVFTIYKQNINDLEWFLDFCNHNGVSYYFEFARESAFLNNNGTVLDSLKFSNSDLNYIEKVLNSVGFLNRSDRDIKWKRAKTIYQGKNQPFICNMGKESLVMNPNGDIFPCLEMIDLLNMGNITAFDGDLDKLLNSQKALDIIKKIEQKECQPCGMLCVHKIENLE